MTVTARMHKLSNAGKVLGFGSICLDEVIVIDGIRLIEGQHGKFVSMPSRKKDDETYTDIVYPVTKAMRDKITEVVCKAYDEAE